MFIPARGGSKRIPKKNIRSFLGQPMIEWPVRACLETGLFDSVFVSTDDVDIAHLASKSGAEILKRRKSLSDDFTHTTAVLQDAIKEMTWLDDNTWIYKIYPTTPATADVISDFVNFTEIEDEGFSISVSRAQVPVQRSLIMGPGGQITFREPEFALARTQDLEPVYLDSGKLYGGRKSEWLETDTPLLSQARGYQLPDWLSVDLDTQEDWELAEYKFKRRFSE